MTPLLAWLAGLFGGVVIGWEWAERRPIGGIGAPVAVSAVPRTPGQVDVWRQIRVDAVKAESDRCVAIVERHVQSLVGAVAPWTGELPTTSASLATDLRRRIVADIRAGLKP